MLYVIWKENWPLMSTKNTFRPFISYHQRKNIYAVCGVPFTSTLLDFPFSFLISSSLPFYSCSIAENNSHTRLRFSLKNVNSPQRDGDSDAVSKLRHDWSPLIYEWPRSQLQCILHRDVAQWVTLFLAQNAANQNKTMLETSPSISSPAVLLS